MAIPNADRVQVIKWEAVADGGSTDEPFPAGVTQVEDALSARGIYFQPTGSPGDEDEDVYVYRDSDNLVFHDITVGADKTLFELLGFDLEAHRQIEQLTHRLDRSYYTEFTYSGWKVTAEIVWTDSGKTTKIREYEYTWSGSKVTQEVQKQYVSGVLDETITLVYAYSANQISDITATRT